MRKRKEQRGLIDIDHIDVPFFGPSPPKTMAEKAMTYFRVDDVFQSYLDAGSSVVSDFLKTSENDVLSFCDFLRNKQQKTSAQDSEVMFYLDEHLPFSIRPSRGDICAYRDKKTRKIMYSMVCDYDPSIGVRIYTKSESGELIIRIEKSIVAMIRILS